MTHPIQQRLTEVKIQDFDNLVGETINHLAVHDVICLVMASGKWCKLTSDEGEEYSTTVLISESATDLYEVKILAGLGMLTAAEMTEWQRHLAAIDNEVQERQRLHAIERMQQLITAYPDDARVPGHWIRGATMKNAKLSHCILYWLHWKE